jgi:hypothetical protein
MNQRHLGFFLLYRKVIPRRYSLVLIYISFQFIKLGNKREVTLIFTLPCNTSAATSGAGTAYPSEHLSSSPVFSGVRGAQSLVFCVVFCGSLFVHLYFFLWPLHCLSFFDLVFLITQTVLLPFSPLYLSEFSFLSM